MMSTSHDQHVKSFRSLKKIKMGTKNKDDSVRYNEMVQLFFSLVLLFIFREISLNHETLLVCESQDGFIPMLACFFNKRPISSQMK